MLTETFFVPDISCDHCTRTIEREMGTVEGVHSVQADVSSRRVTLTYDEPATTDSVRASLGEIGYPPDRLDG